MATQQRGVGTADRPEPPDPADPPGAADRRRASDTDPYYGVRAMQWVSEHGDELWPRYAGKWIAVDDDDGLVAVADDLDSVMRLAQERGYRLPLVSGIPVESRTNLKL